MLLNLVPECKKIQLNDGFLWNSEGKKKRHIKEAREYLYIHNEEKFWTTLSCIFLRIKIGKQQVYRLHVYVKCHCLHRIREATWTMPPGRPPRSSSRLSDFSQSAATIFINVPFALICNRHTTSKWHQIRTKHIALKYNCELNKFDMSRTRTP